MIHDTDLHRYMSELVETYLEHFDPNKHQTTTNAKGENDEIVYRWEIKNPDNNTELIGVSITQHIDGDGTHFYARLSVEYVYYQAHKERYRVTTGDIDSRNKTIVVQSRFADNLRESEPQTIHWDTDRSTFIEKIAILKNIPACASWVTCENREIVRY